jgi:integrase/recombinase XerC
MAAATIKRRRTSLPQFVRHITPVTLHTVTGRDVEDWVATKRAPRTRHAYRSDVAAFYSWGVKRRIFTSNPVHETDSIRLPRPLPKPLPPAAIPMLLQTAEPRVRLALTLAIYVGLRCFEVAQLTTTDVGHGMLTVRGGKGSKDRTIPLHPVAARELAGWRLPQGARYVDVSPAWLGRKVSAHLRAQGIDATMHCGRHSFGTELARVSRDVMLVQQLMGHESPSTTMGYIRLNAPGAGIVDVMFDDDTAA